MSTPAEALRLASRRYATYGRMLDRAVATILIGGVKEHRFTPSGRVLHTVVGRLGDEFIDPKKPYCSCSDFFFRVMKGKTELCYHLLSYRIALEQGKVDVVNLDDEEYDQFFAMMIRDVFSVLDRSGGTSSLRLP
jgi:predicted nucleic acid-binding Zn finger protein